MDIINDVPTLDTINRVPTLWFLCNQEKNSLIKGGFLGALFLLTLILQTDIPSAKYYTFLGDRGELQMRVSIWGEIGSPGMYSIPEGSDLLLLVTIAGGPTREAAISRIRIVRSFPEPEVLHVNLDEFFKTGKRDKIPALSPGDMVFVQKTRYRAFLELMEVAGELFYVGGFLFLIYNTIRGD